MKNHLLKISSLGLVALALVLAPALTRAQVATTNATGQSAPAPAPKSKKGLPFHGKVSAVDTGAETLTVSSNLVLNITSTTRISNATNGEPAILSDITVGENISGYYLTDSSGQLNAKTIHIGTKAGKAKKKKKVTPPPTPDATSTNSAPAI